MKIIFSPSLTIEIKSQPVTKDVLAGNIDALCCWFNDTSEPPRHQIYFGTSLVQYRYELSEIHERRKQ